MSAWLDPAAVLRWLHYDEPTEPDEQADIDRVVAGAAIYVQRCRPDQWVTPDPATPDDPDSRAYIPDDEVLQGAVMYAARELRRRNTPAGIETWAEGGAVFVAKYDADIERALRTGEWNMPGVG